jgi:hypothetical protein
MPSDSHVSVLIIVVQLHAANIPYENLSTRLKTASVVKSDLGKDSHKLRFTPVENTPLSYWSILFSMSGYCIFWIKLKITFQCFADRAS